MSRGKPVPDGSEDGVRVCSVNDIAGRRPVVQVVPYYPPHIGGMEVVAHTIAEGLARDRHVEVLTSTSVPTPAPRTEYLGNLRVRRFRTLEFAHVPHADATIDLARVPRRTMVHVHVAIAYAPEVVWLYSKLLRRPYIRISTSTSILREVRPAVPALQAVHPGRGGFLAVRRAGHRRVPRSSPSS